MITMLWFGGRLCAEANVIVPVWPDTEPLLMLGNVPWNSTERPCHWFVVQPAPAAVSDVVELALIAVVACVYS